MKRTNIPNLFSIKDSSRHSISCNATLHLPTIQYMSGIYVSHMDKIDKDFGVTNQMDNNIMWYSTTIYDEHVCLLINL